MFPVRTAIATRHRPIVTWSLIAANSAVFLVQISLPRIDFTWFVWSFALVPARYFDGSVEIPPAGGLVDYLPFVTNMFLHGGWLHLILNMWALWVFGPAIEDRVGSGRYLAFYLATGVIASLTHALFNQQSAVPALGASGAIAGVMGCYLRLFPLSRLVVVVPILFIPLLFEVPALLFIGLWFFMQILQGTAGLLAPSDAAMVAWWAHIGGFVAGLVLGRPMCRRRGGRRPHHADEDSLGF